MIRMQYGNPFGHTGLRLGFVIFFLVILVVALVALAFLIRIALNQRAGRPMFAGPRRAWSSPSPALQILDERFAKGEIDEDEYKRRRDTLREHDIQ
jgi:putative membrane protein